MLVVIGKVFEVPLDATEQDSGRTRDGENAAMPKVSVIVPNYNHAAFLGLRIDSILEQTYRDFELLILDDASTDDSREVIARYARDPRVTIECNQTNAGSPYLQWRKGPGDDFGRLRVDRRIG